MTTTIIYSTSKDKSNAESNNVSKENQPNNSSNNMPNKASNDTSNNAQNNTSNNAPNNTSSNTSANASSTTSNKTPNITSDTAPNNASGNSSNNTSNSMCLTDKDIALDLLTASKTTVTSLAKALTESTNPQVRETLKNQLTACINSHYRLSDIAISKGWYNAFAQPTQQLQDDLNSIKNLS